MRRVIGGLSVLFIMFMGAVHAATTDTISYQGTLRDASGAPIANGNYPFRFTLVTAAAEGTEVWSESTNVSVVNGTFSAALGTSTPFPASLWRENAELWLLIEADVDGGGISAQEVFGPRVPVRATAVSLFAKDANRLNGVAESAFARQVDLTSATGQLSTLSTSVIALNSDVEALQGASSSAQTALVSLQADVGSLEIALGETQSALETLQTDFEAHDHDSQYAPLISRVIDVPASGTSSVNGQALLAAVDGLTGPALVRLAPGNYELGDATLALPSSVDIEGAGIGRSIVSRNAGSGTIIALGTDSEMRDLAVTSTSVSPMTGVLISGRIGRLNSVRVSLQNSGAGPGHVGLRVDDSGDATVRDSLISVLGSSNGMGGFVSDIAGVQVVSSELTLLGSETIARNGNTAYGLQATSAVSVQLVVSLVAASNFQQGAGLLATGSTLDAVSSRFEGSGGAVSSVCAAAIFDSSSAISLQGTSLTATANGGTRSALQAINSNISILSAILRCPTGVGLSASASTIVAQHSIVSGTTSVDGLGGSTRLAMCQLDGAVAGTSIRYLCYDASLTPVP